jgi:hypothetical protein
MKCLEQIKNPDLRFFMHLREQNGVSYVLRKAATGIAGFFIVFWLVFQPGKAAAQVQTVTNLDLMARAVDSSAAVLCDRIAADEGDIIYVTPMAQKEAVAGFVWQRFLENFSDRRMQVILTDTLGAFDHSLSLLVPRAAVRYDRCFRRGFPGKRFVDRVATVEIAYWMNRSGSGNVATGRIEKSIKDRIPFSWIPKAEEGDLILNPVPCPSGSWMKKWGEPVLVITVAGILAYFLFSVRN